MGNDKVFEAALQLPADQRGAYLTKPAPVTPACAAAWKFCSARSSARAVS